MSDTGKLGVGIIGCGLIGAKRAKAIGSKGYLVACADINIDRAQFVASETAAQVFTDWRELLSISQIDVVIISTLHDMLASIALAAIKADKNVFLEKPAARFSEELVPLIDAEKKQGVKVHVGFNHRYHRSVLKARQLIDDGLLGNLMFLRARYGHGGRVGYDKEWRAKPEISGGGELIDQGSHLIDLSRWFLGDFSEIQGFANTYYWDMPVDDNAFLLLKTKFNQVAFLHASCTEWKNLFSLEIYGQAGKIDLSGLGGSYGPERVTWYKMLPEMGPPETMMWEYPMADNSWTTEMNEFFDDIFLNRKPASNLEDAFETLKVIEQVYEKCGYDNRA